NQRLPARCRLTELLATGLFEGPLVLFRAGGVALGSALRGLTRECAVESRRTAEPSSGAGAHFSDGVGTLPIGFGHEMRRHVRSDAGTRPPNGKPPLLLHL